MDLIIGLVVALVPAQVIDGRVAFFIGVGTILARRSWRLDRDVGVSASIAAATAPGLAVFFALIRADFFRSSAVLGCVALLIGFATTWVGSTWWGRRRFMGDAARALGMPVGQVGPASEPTPTTMRGSKV